MKTQHPDNVSPVQHLKNRLHQVDKYIQRLERNGDTGSEFLMFYKGISKDYAEAINKLNEQK